MNAPNPGDPSPSAPFEVERVEWVPSSADALEVRVTGRWRTGSPGAGASLVVDDAGVRRAFAAASEGPSGDGRWSARFAVPVELRGALGARLGLRADERELALPAASPGPPDGSPAPPPATIVDSGVLEQRRARRDSQADEAVIRRAQAAEATAATLETQLGHLEGRLRATLAERDALIGRLRAAQQAEEAERRVRGEAEEERDEARDRAAHELALLRGRVVAAEEHAAALADEMDAIRREGAEAQHAAATARAAADRAIALAGGAGAQAELDRLGREAALLGEQLHAQRAAREQAEAALALQADRVAEVEATVSLLESELERRASIQTAVQGELELLRAALADVRARADEESVRESGALRALEELKATASGLRERVAAVEEAERIARAQVRETQAELAARDGDLNRLRVELERGRAELATAHARQDGTTAALREAERTVVAVRQEAAELQSRLEEERRRRFEAEAALKVELARERERFGETVAQVEGELHARIAAERSAFEAQAASIEALVGPLRARLASAGTALEARLVEHTRERDAAFAARDAARAEAERVKLAVAADLERAAVERETLLARLAAVEEELAGARPAVQRAQGALADAEVALAAARAQTERRAREVGGQLATRLAEVEVERDTLSAALAAREEELAVLRAVAVDDESRTATVEQLVADVVRMAGELRAGYDRQLTELTDRVERELRTLRIQLEEERAARWVAEQELAAERARSVETGTFAAAALHRTELEATRRELAAAQEQLAAERLRAPNPQTSQLLADLEAAGSRLKDSAEDEGNVAEGAVAEAEAGEAIAPEAVAAEAIAPDAAAAEAVAAVTPEAAATETVEAAGAAAPVVADGPDAAVGSDVVTEAATTEPAGAVAPDAAAEPEAAAAVEPDAAAVEAARTESAAAVAPDAAATEGAAVVPDAPADPAADAAVAPDAPADSVVAPDAPADSAADAAVAPDAPADRADAAAAAPDAPADSAADAENAATARSEVPAASRAALDAALAALATATPPGAPLPEPASSATAGAPEEAPAPEGTPLRPRVVRAAERPEVGWLAPAIARLAAQDGALAAEVIVELLPAQAGAVRDPLVYGLTIDGHGSYRVAVDAERAQVQPRTGTFWPADVEASISGPPAALAPLVGGTARRKVPGAKLAGRKRRLRRLLRGRRRPVDLGLLGDRGIRPAPEPMLAVLAAAVDPGWTAGHRFTIAYALAGGATVAVEVRDGQPLRVRTGVDAGTDAAAATVALAGAALLPLLTRSELPAGERVTVAGDRHAVAVLHSWFDRAQGLPAA